MNIREYLIKEGFTLIDEKFYKKMQEWENWYKGYVEDFHQYSIYNGSCNVNQSRARMQAAKMGAEYWSNLLWNQDCFITVDSSKIKHPLSKRIYKVLKRDSDNKSQLLINVVMEENNFNSNYNALCEKAFAMGNGAVVMYDNKLDYIDYKGIEPLSYSNGKIESCAFSSVFNHIEYGKCLYLMIHIKEKQGYTIKNKFFKIIDDSDNITEFTEKEFKTMSVKSEFKSGVKRFTILKPNIANNISDNNPLGISIYANSIDILKMIDLALDGIKVSMELGRPRVAITSKAMKSVPGKGGKAEQVPIFDTKDVAFYVLDANLSGDTIIKDITVAYRAGDFELSLQKALTLFSQMIGLGEKAFKWEDGALKTATEVISENSTMYQTMRKHQEIVKENIVDICKAILEMNKKDYDIDIKVEFDDSIVIDKEQEKNRSQQLYRDGVIPKYVYLTDHEGYTEEEAKILVKEAKEEDKSNSSVTDLFGTGGVV